MDRPQPPRDSLSTNDIRAMYLRRRNEDTSSIGVPRDAANRRAVAGVVLVGVTCALLVGLSRYGLLPSMKTLSDTTYDVAAERLASAVDAALDFVGQRPESPVTTDDVALTAARKAATAERGTRKRVPIASSWALPLMPLISVETVQAIGPVLAADVAISAAIETETAEPLALPPDNSVVDTSIYSSDDADVSPPVAIRTPGIATDRGHGDKSPSFIEILVSESGRVESAWERQRPSTVGAALQTVTALSVVKAWRFSPALKDGQPVKYRTTVPFVQTMNPAGMTDGTR